jgi:dolichyl-diphosphooligosaccharide--protein glycosyltransferase
LILPICGVAAAVRLLPWRTVFTDDGVRMLFDSDPYYHLLQAGRALVGGFRATWFDPGLSWPEGAGVLWPPLWDLVIAGTTKLVFGLDPTMAQLERVGAVLPVLVGTVTVPLVFLVARLLLGRDRAPWAALLFALAPSNVVLSTVGRPDQHALEILLNTAVMASYAGAVLADRPVRRWGAVAGLAVALALSFWNWQGSALGLVAPAACAGIAHVLLAGNHARRFAIPLAVGGGLAAALLAGSVMAWGAPGALGRASLAGLTGLHVAITAGAAAFAVALAAAGRLVPGAPPARRVAEVVLAAGIPMVVALASSAGVRAGVGHGLTAVAAASPWHATISEFRPLLFSCEGTLLDDALDMLRTWGLLFPAVVAAAWPLAARWKRGSLAPVLLLGTWGAIFLVLALARRRFGAYFTVPAVLLGTEGLWYVVERVRGLAGPSRVPRFAWMAAATLVAVAPQDLHYLSSPPENAGECVDAARWLRTQPVRKGHEGVLAPWEIGHLVLYYGRRPIVVSPFGTDLGAGPMEFASRFRMSREPAEAEELLFTRRVGYVVLGNPAFDVTLDQQLAPAGTPQYSRVVCSLTARPMNHIDPGFDDVASARLFYFDALTREKPAPAFTRLRLVYETPAISSDHPPLHSVKVYEVVRGAEVRIAGAVPGEELRVSAVVRTDSGRDFTWAVGARADEEGVAVFRVPYASGPNGAGAATVTVDLGSRRISLPLTNQDVLEGRLVEVRLDR